MRKFILPILLIISSLGIYISLLFGFPTIFKLFFLFSHVGLSFYTLKVHLLFYTNRYIQIIFSLILYLASLIVLGTFFFYFATLSKSVIGFIFIIISIVLSLLSIYSPNKKQPTKILIDIKDQIFKQYSIADILIGSLLVSYIIISTKAFGILMDISITEAIRSPWKIIPNDFIALYILATISILISSWYTRWKTIQLAFISIHYFLTISIALIIYPIGYGFDPFIHRATEEIIAFTGTLSPKPLYYIGQYSLVAILHHVSNISLSIIDYLLVPLLFSIAVPATIFSAIHYPFKKSARTSLLISFIPLFLPLHLFITTTPQSLANTFTLIVIFSQLFFLYLHKIKRISLIKYLIFTFLLIITTVAIHPLAGIPNLIFGGLILLFLFKPRKKLYKALHIFCISLYSILSAVLLPAVFIFNHLRANGSWETAFKSSYEIKNSLLPILDPYHIYFQNRFNLFGDIAYFFIYNWLYILIILLVIAAVFLYKKGRLRILMPYILTFFILFGNYYVLKSFISFDMLIDYERIDYPARVLMIGFYFILPIVGYVLSLSYDLIKKHYSPYIGHITVTIIAIFITSSMYSAYPREDGYIYNTGYNVSQSDITAVHYIERDTFEKNISDYVVLANQTVSVAALKEFGFKTYYPTKDHGELFYYPIPTSSPMYQFYVDMVYKMPSQQIINDAAEFINIDTVYFVVNKYWARSREIINLAKKQADYWTALDNDSIYIFKYTKKERNSSLDYLPTGVDLTQ